MKEVFKIAEFNEEGLLKLLKKEFSTYSEAVKFIDEELPAGIYQIQKVFVKE